MEIARALDIIDIKITTLDGCEGVLLTDRPRSYGSIIVNDKGGQNRARFSVAHELAHFLLEKHVLSAQGGFACRSADMSEVSSKTQDRRQEAEANAFAVELLAPAYLIRRFVDADPSIEVMHEMRDALDISAEVAGRILVDRHDEALALVACHNGKIRYSVRNDRFPWIAPSKGEMACRTSETARAFASGGRYLSGMAEVTPAAWTNADIPELFEQVRIGRDGFSLTLLCATLPDGAD